MKVFEFKDVSFYIKNRPILNNVSFSASRGEWVMIAGPNGAGKSTIVKLSGAIWKKKSGKITIWGKEQERYTPRELARILSVLPPEFSPLYNIKVIDFVKLGIYAKTGFLSFYSGKNQQDIDFAIETAEIKSLLKKGIKELSMGEIQRVRIAKVLAQNTPVILLDEPLAHLDIKHRIWALELFARLRASGKTLITVIHDFVLAYPYPDKFVLIKDGNVTFRGGREQKDLLIKAFSETFSTHFKEKSGYLLPLRE